MQALHWKDNICCQHIIFVSHLLISLNFSICFLIYSLHFLLHIWNSFRKWIHNTNNIFIFYNQNIAKQARYFFLVRYTKKSSALIGCWSGQNFLSIYLTTVWYPSIYWAVLQQYNFCLFFFQLTFWVVMADSLWKITQREKKFFTSLGRSG